MLPPSTSSQLLQRVARGDGAAVREVLRAHGPLVQALVRGRVRDPGIAEDLVQEIFIQVWRNAHRYDPAIASESTWIATIARRRLIDRVRRTTAEPQPVPLEFDFERETGDDPAQAAETGDEARFTARTLNKLEPGQRRLLALALVQGLTHAQIATVTGLPLGTVKTRLRQGLERARTLMREARAGSTGEAPA